ncbi:MAG TPA: hypothetical protein VEU96_08505 [Bryobacteraceae bacterium]|nr:hypothetical protein [Bryobacteraceae bacterium]
MVWLSLYGKSVRMKVMAILLCSAPLWAATLPALISRTGNVSTENIALKVLDPAHQYSLLYSISSLRQLRAESRVGTAILAAKTIHAGDPDYYVNCHATRTLFGGTWGTVKNVVDTGNPENSLILRKPVSSSETEGIAASRILSHGGGVRFTKESPEYATILSWIKGRRNRRWIRK